VKRCKDAGINRHFVKPVDPEAFREVLAKAENGCIRGLPSRSTRDAR
jgi:hypothetical protein